MKKIISILILISAFIFAGCGGGGGGSGSLLNSLSGNQTEGGGGSSSETPIDSAYSLVNIGSYSVASATFNQILNDTSSSGEEKALAASGLGLIEIKEKGAADISPDNSYFKKALSYDSNNKEAKLGQAIIYLAHPGTQEVEILESLGLDDINATVSSSYLDISSGEAHALMALAYFENGEDEKAKAHIEKARELDENNITIQQIAEGLDAIIGN